MHCTCIKKNKKKCFNKHETLFQTNSIKARKHDQARPKKKKDGQELHVKARPELHLFCHYTKIRDAGFHTDLMKILRDVRDIIKQAKRLLEDCLSLSLLYATPRYK